MILSDQQIHQLIDSSKILILPEFDKKNIRPVGIRLHLGNQLLIPKENLTVDLRDCEEELFESIEISDTGYALQPGEFILGTTHESILVPRNIVCHLEGRSTVARLGLAIHCTSGIIDGNYEEPRTIVFEIKNMGPFTLILKPQLPLGLLVFSELTSEIVQATQNQYRGQNGVVAPNLCLQLK